MVVFIFFNKKSTSLLTRSINDLQTINLPFVPIEDDISFYIVTFINIIHKMIRHIIVIYETEFLPFMIKIKTDESFN